LWSAYQSQRQNAKAELRDAGVEAIGPLVSLLEEFVFTPGSTFGDRKEKQFRRYLDYRRNTTSGIDREEGPGSMEEMSAVAVRVKQDGIDLLGSLRAEAAVPVLIQLMFEELEIAGRKHDYPEMDAIRKIGPPAIPGLIKTIETADQTAKSIEITGQRWSLKQRQQIRESVRHVIQERTVVLLGRMRDARVLPFLDELMVKSSDDFLVSYVLEAIQNIKQ
jgi:hypothetical protein